jgi:hypothetical protein
VDGRIVFPDPPAASYIITTRCNDRRTFVAIPSFLPPGTYHIHARTHLYVNPLRKIVQEFQSEDFEVVDDSQ